MTLIERFRSTPTMGLIFLHFPSFFLSLFPSSLSLSLSLSPFLSPFVYIIIFLLLLFKEEEEEEEEEFGLLLLFELLWFGCVIQVLTQQPCLVNEAGWSGLKRVEPGGVLHWQSAGCGGRRGRREGGSWPWVGNFDAIFHRLTDAIGSEIRFNLLMSLMQHWTVLDRSFARVGGGLQGGLEGEEENRQWNLMQEIISGELEPCQDWRGI